MWCKDARGRLIAVSTARIVRKEVVVLEDRITVVYAGETPPEQWRASLFLAGPTPRSDDVASWRSEALAEVEDQWGERDGLVVFVPEPRDGGRWPDYDGERRWELYWGDRVDAVVFWIPRGPGLPGLTTNDEWGRWKDSGRTVLGTPTGGHASISDHPVPPGPAAAPPGSSTTGARSHTGPGGHEPSSGSTRKVMGRSSPIPA